MKLRRRTWLITAALVAAAGVWGLYDRFIEDGNFSIYKENTLYRSATLSHHEWKEILREHPPFRSVLNLRGVNDEAEWYKREKSLSAEKGIAFYTLGMSANHQPDMVTMETLVEMMRAAPKPLLVHCKQGADRTGLALALYAYAIDGKPAAEAARQMSLFWGHFPWLTSRTGAMDKAFAAYVAAHPQTTASTTLTN
ncbi:MAG: protein tyrosine phosphatase [Pseudomonas fluorescens]|nr:MAG: protein tyrosine phosphatase [Pseudomonas fluorescens]